MKLFAALGPGDIVATHRAMQAGNRSADQTAIPFSTQLAEYCRLRGIALLATSSCDRPDETTDSNPDTPDPAPIRLVNRPAPWAWRGGWRFHAGRIRYAWRLARMARRFGADLALIDSGTSHYFALALFRLLGVPVAVNFHNVRWPQGFPPRRRIHRAVMALDDLFFRHVAAGAIGCSPACGEQARARGAARLPWFEWAGQFSREGMVARRPDPAAFRLLFAGRIEPAKGVFDLLAIARALHGRAPRPVIIDICGDGGALDALRQAVADANLAEPGPTESGLAGSVRVHGRLARAEMLALYARADAVIVPTRGDFCEGMPLVCAEAVLMGLPIVTSRLSNALPLLGPAIAKAEPEDIESYAAAILRLMTDAPFRDRLTTACPTLAPRFLDRTQSYPAALDRLIQALALRPPREVTAEAVFERLG